MKHLLFDSYIKMIKNSVGTRMFRNAYFVKDNKKIDVLKNGDLSCAVFVSSILKLFGLISVPHATVKGTIKDLEKNGWKKIKELKIGAVLHWDLNPESKKHEHLGFYIGNNKAVSNSSQKRMPIVHHCTYNNRRKIIGIYWNKKLGQ